MKLSELRPKEAAPEAAPGDTVTPELPAVEEPTGVAQVVTPSGLDIYYQAGPKRLYRVRSGGPITEFISTNIPGWDGWTEVPSVSEALSVLEKGGLSWWGMKVGVVGTRQLLLEGKITDPITEIVLPEEEIVELLKANRLTVNHVKDKAADRGTNVHSAFELYAETGTLPNPDMYPANEAGYVAGLVAFLKDSNLQVKHSEVMVASAEAGYAGRFDVIGSIDGEVVTKTYPKRTPVKTRLKWDEGLLDLKTSKGVYPSYHLQLAAYEGAMEECGYGTVDNTGVVRVTDDGRYELVEGRATFEDFLTVLNTYRVIQRLEGK